MSNVRRRRASIQLTGLSVKRRRSMSSGPPSSRSTVSLPSSNSSGRYRTPVRARRTGRVNFSRSRGTKRNEGANNSRAGYSRKKGRSVRKEARKKSVKVPSKLRKQVKQVLASDDFKGVYMDILQPTIIKPIDNLQNVVMASQRRVDGYIGLNFDPISISNMAAELFNNASANPTADFGQGGYTNAFNYQSLKINVVDSSIKYIMRNNTTNNLIVKLWDISPKSISTNGSAYTDPVAWINLELARMTATPSLNPGPSTGALDQLNKYNPFGVVIQTIGFNPKMLPSFNQFWSMDETVINLEPGKTYVHYLPGPKNKVYDFRKYFQNGSVTVNTYQKFSKQTMICLQGDLQGTATGEVGRYTDIVAGTGYGLLVEPRTYVKMRLPEQAGFVTQVGGLAVGSSQAMTNRRDAFIIKNWTLPVNNVSAIQRIGDENEAIDAPATS